MQGSATKFRWGPDLYENMYQGSTKKTPDLQIYFNFQPQDNIKLSSPTYFLYFCWKKIGPTLFFMILSVDFKNDKIALSSIKLPCAIVTNFVISHENPPFYCISGFYVKFHEHFTWTTFLFGRA